MSKLKLVIDSGCDATLEEAKLNDVTIVPFSISFDDKTYLKDHIDITLEEFYEKLLTREVYPKTSLPSIQDYAEVFEKELNEGKEILCICLSSKLSGSYQSAVNAKNIVLENYPDGKICVIDSLMATYPYFLLGLKGKKLYNEGKTLEEVEEILLKERDYTRIYFVLDSLKFLEKGGRLGKGAVLASSILNIKPVLEFSDGEIKPIKKVRGIKKAFSAVIDLLEIDVLKLIKTREKHEILLFYGGSPSYADEIKGALCNRFEKKEAELHKVNIGAIISTHTGPDIVGVGVTLKDYV